MRTQELELIASLTASLEEARRRHEEVQVQLEQHTQYRDAHERLHRWLLKMRQYLPVQTTEPPEGWSDDHQMLQLLDFLGSAHLQITHADQRVDAAKLMARAASLRQLGLVRHRLAKAVLRGVVVRWRHRHREFRQTMQHRREIRMVQEQNRWATLHVSLRRLGRLPTLTLSFVTP